MLGDQRYLQATLSSEQYLATHSRAAASGTNFCRLELEVALLAELFALAALTSG